jgi:hypothetical protein
LRLWSQLKLYLCDGRIEIDNPDFIGDFVKLVENAICPSLGKDQTRRQAAPGGMK